MTLCESDESTAHRQLGTVSALSVRYGRDPSTHDRTRT